MDWLQNTSGFMVVAILVTLVSASIIFILLRKPPEKTLTKSGSTPNGANDKQTAPNEKNSLSFIEHLNQGNTWVRKYQYEKAIYHFKEAIKLKPEDPSIHFKIGRLYVQREDYKNALNAFKTSLNLNAKQVEAHYEIARIYHQLQDADKTKNALGNALKLNPTHEESLKLQVKLLEQEHRYKEAVESVQKLIETAQSPIKYQELLADLLIKLGEAPKAIAELEKLIVLSPNERLHYLGKIGQAYFDQAQFSKAIEQFKLILQEQGTQSGDGNYMRSIKNQLAAALCNEGVKQYQANDAPKAIQHYQEALMYDDSNADIHYNLGKALIQAHDSSKAIRHFELALSINAHDASCHYELAVLQDEKGLVQDALTHYQKALELDPQNAQACFGLGTLYGVEGNMEKAIKMLSTAIRINPNYTDAFYNLAVALERKKDINKAIKFYKKVLSLDKNHEKAKSNLAHIQHTQKQGLRR